MIWVETPIIDEFRRYIVLYMRYIEGIFFILSGSIAELCRFREKLGNANDNIKLEWQGTPSVENAINPAIFDQHQLRQVNSSNSTLPSCTRLNPQISD